MLKHSFTENLFELTCYSKDTKNPSLVNQMAPSPRCPVYSQTLKKFISYFFQPSCNYSQISNPFTKETFVTERCCYDTGSVIRRIRIILSKINPSVFSSEHSILPYQKFYLRFTPRCNFCIFCDKNHSPDSLVINSQICSKTLTYNHFQT